MKLYQLYESEDRFPTMDLYADLESDTHEAWKKWGRDKYVEDELDDEIATAKEFARQ